MAVDSTRALATFALDAPASSHADEVARTLVDTLGVALAGYGTDTLEALLRWDESTPAPGPALTWGAGGGRAPGRAALLNGTAAHALDFDDAAPTMPMHPSAVLWPALLAWASTADVDGPDLARAFDVGQSVFRAVGEALPMDQHYPRGWHSTSTVGRLAATAALVCLSRPDLSTALSALGISASMAGGSIANFGTMTKPLHAGLAAHDAVMATQLAWAGVTANPGQLDHPKGYFALFGSADTDRAALSDRLEHWHRAWVDDLSVKQYPSCYGTHRAVDAAIDLRPVLGDSPGDFIAAEVTVHPSGLDPLIPHLPESGLEAKFSLPYTVVRALRDGRLDLDSFDDGALSDPAVAGAMQRVRVRTADHPVGHRELAGQPFADLIVTDARGQTARALVTTTRGDARLPLTDSQLDGKFSACSRAGGWSDADAARLLAALRTLPTASTIDDVSAALRRAEGG